MDKRRKILEAQERLEKTLSCPHLSSRTSIQSLVENQLLLTPLSGTEGEFRSLVEKRTSEVSNFLEMLRSASREDESAPKSHGLSKNDWKLKQQSDQLRVMYREGPKGTPFHTLLCEGFADGPVDCCLCVSWESTLYEKWWPRYSIPTFNVISSSSLQKVRVGEEISLVRVKVPWPLSEREVLLHNFELECFEEDLVIVLLNTIPETDHIDVSTHGFAKDGIPEANGTVRIDVVGGFVLQRVSPNRSYFRAIANMDMKLDFVPPWLINFVARQLIGNGHKLYTKVVASVASGEKEYREVLQKAMYTRIRESLYFEKPEITDMQDAMVGSTPQDVALRSALNNEIEEEQGGQSPLSIESPPVASGNHFSTKPIPLRESETLISPEVEHALGIVDEAIATIHNLQTSNSLGKKSKLPYQAKEAFSLNGEHSLEKAGFDRTTLIDHSGDVPDVASNDDVGSVMGGEFAKTNLTRMQLHATERMSKVYNEVAMKDGGTCRNSNIDGKLRQKKGHKGKKKSFFGLNLT